MGIKNTLSKIVSTIILGSACLSCNDRSLESEAYLVSAPLKYESYSDEELSDGTRITRLVASNDFEKSTKYEITDYNSDNIADEISLFKTIRTPIKNVVKQVAHFSRQKDYNSSRALFDEADELLEQKR